jgi:hypothetical protein
MGEWGVRGEFEEGVVCGIEGCGNYFVGVGVGVGVGLICVFVYTKMTFNP